MATPAMLAGPAAAPPEGVIPNLVNPYSDGSALVIVSSVLLVIMWISVTLRLVTKGFIARKWFWDDATCVVGTLFATAYYGITTSSVKLGHVGTHQWDITLGELLSVPFIKISYLAAVLAPPTYFFIKITFFITYLHLFRPNRALRLAIWLGGIVTLLVYTGFFLALMILTTPGKEGWVAHFEGPKQTSSAVLSMPLPGVGLGIDLYILVIPIIGIWNLQLPLQRKIGVGLVFFTAILAVIASLLSIIYRVTITRNPFADLTYNLMPVFLTSNIEMTLGVTVSCMPTFSNLLRHSLPIYERLRSRLTNSRMSRSRTGVSSKSGMSDHHNNSGYKPASSDTASDHKAGFGSEPVVYEMQPTRNNPVKTRITGGSREAFEGDGDGVHLRYDYEVRHEYNPSVEFPRQGGRRITPDGQEKKVKEVV
ncbi:hypothetical protein MMC25_005996 [Agyrium rufum]|nr:hypothetical protein [Agyrium rufum]